MHHPLPFLLNFSKKNQVEYFHLQEILANATSASAMPLDKFFFQGATAEKKSFYKDKILKHYAEFSKLMNTGYLFNVVSLLH